MTTIMPELSPMRSNIDVASLYHAANVVEEEEEASGILVEYFNDLTVKQLVL
jgi:hypothetical protein